MSGACSKGDVRRTVISIFKLLFHLERVQARRLRDAQEWQPDDIYTQGIGAWDGAWRIHNIRELKH